MFVEGQVGAGESVGRSAAVPSHLSRVATRDGFRVLASSAWAPDREFSRVANALFSMSIPVVNTSRLAYANYG